MAVTYHAWLARAERLPISRAVSASLHADYGARQHPHAGDRKAAVIKARGKQRGIERYLVTPGFEATTGQRHHQAPAAVVEVERDGPRPRQREGKAGGGGHRVGSDRIERSAIDRIDVRGRRRRHHGIAGSELVDGSVEVRDPEIA